MAEAARSLFTFREYLEVEAASPIRHEFLDGVVYAIGAEPPWGSRDRALDELVDPSTAHRGRAAACGRVLRTQTGTC